MMNMMVVSKFRVVTFLFPFFYRGMVYTIIISPIFGPCHFHHQPYLLHECNFCLHSLEQPSQLPPMVRVCSRHASANRCSASLGKCISSLCHCISSIYTWRVNSQLIWHFAINYTQKNTFVHELEQTSTMNLYILRDIMIFSTKTVGELMMKIYGR